MNIFTSICRMFNRTSFLVEGVQLLQDNCWRESVSLLHSNRAKINDLPEREQRNAWIALGIGYIATSNWELGAGALQKAMPLCSKNKLLAAIVSGAITTARRGPEPNSIPFATTNPKRTDVGRLVPLEAVVLKKVFFRIICSASLIDVDRSKEYTVLFHEVREEVLREMQEALLCEGLDIEGFNTNERSGS